jgi:hypothetical protein
MDNQPGVRQALQGLDRRLRASGTSDAELAAEQEALFARMRAELEPLSSTKRNHYSPSM